MNKAMIKLDELKIFVTTAEAGSFAAAAGVLGVAPSVISKSIKSLEAKLRTTLFNRTTRSLRITDEGRWLLERAASTLGEVDAIAARFLDHSSEPAGRLIVDAATPFALHAIAPIVAGFRQRYPKVEIVLHSSEAVSDLIANRVDVAIRIGALKDSTLKAKRIGTTRRGIYASPGYLARQGSPSSPADLHDHFCLGFTEPQSLNVWPIMDESGEAIAINPVISANSGETLKQLAVFHNGIACLSSFTVRRELERGELVALLADRIEAQAIPINAVYYSEAAVARHIRLFLDFLKEEMGDLS